jgi:hypothetical protein
MHWRTYAAAFKSRVHLDVNYLSLEGALGEDNAARALINHIYATDCERAMAAFAHYIFLLSLRYFYIVPAVRGCVSLGWRYGQGPGDGERKHQGANYYCQCTHCWCAPLKVRAFLSHWMPGVKIKPQWQIELQRKKDDLRNVCTALGDWWLDLVGDFPSVNLRTQNCSLCLLLRLEKIV